MAAKNTKMAFEGVLYRGTAGTTAATQITNHRDCTIDNTLTKADTTVSGTGAGPSMESSRVTSIAHQLTFTLLNKIDDASLTALRTVAAAGTPIALRGKDYSSGKGPDFDYTVEESHGRPFKGEQTFQFTCTPTDEADRDPVIANLYV